MNHVIARVETEGSLHIVTGSKDRSLRLYKCEALVSMDNPKRFGAYKILRGHTSSIQSVTVDPSRDMLCSGSWDSTIKLWAVERSEEDGQAVSLKKRRMNFDSSGPEESQLEGSATSTLWDIHDVLVLLAGLSSKRYIQHLGIILLGSGMSKK